MFSDVTLPVWLLVLILLFAAVTFATHFLNPTVRWFLRARMERVVAQLNTRLHVPIQPFKLARRHDTILRLIYDPEVTRAVADHARATGLREDAAFALAQKYAREIVPSFSATAYFGFASRAARWLSNSLYDVQLEQGGENMLRGIDPQSTVVFVVNHRSNMDYVLLTWLVSPRAALSYAVGEWARVWPLSGLIRAMGAYFIRRHSHSALYRTVLARYVQMATEAGVTQAMFPEGRLSLDGRPGPVKMGLLSYIIAGAKRDVTFVPVAFNYDRVLEDRLLLRAGELGKRRFRGSVLRNGSRILGWIGARLIGREHRFGHVAVAFGAPLSLRDVPDATDVAAITKALMLRLHHAVPVLPVPLVCTVLQGAQGPVTPDRLERENAALCACLAKMPEVMCLSDVPAALAVLVRRGLVRCDNGFVSVMPGQEPVIAFYGASIAHHFRANAAVQEDLQLSKSKET
ncbi:1-acyl-sn-glycerol-3-phosphate acyltransferase [Oceaniglobus ichthyenteri]|uniref:1-acyl-sn-glycerol-3-phosphate acyltransferase n=1 Tax=Oceaniglobus ichthyenteri TaxID=2136177 RepID=UPI000D34F205|nr:1-acyl-sn-glycerol-3-phosphate acyltransferase [Oceaniglobus ichthyenteri]